MPDSEPVCLNHSELSLTTAGGHYSVKASRNPDSYRITHTSEKMASITFTCATPSHYMTILSESVRINLQENYFFTSTNKLPLPEKLSRSSSPG